MAHSTDSADRRSELPFNTEDPFLIYFCNQLLSDMTFIVGADNKRIPGHKIILSRSSYEFFKIFNNTEELKKNELPIEDVTEEAFLCFLKFFYTKNVDLDGIDRLAVLKLAYRFQVKPLIEKCETHLCQVVKKENCLEFYTKTSFLNQDSKLKNHIFNEIEINFEWLTWDEDQKQIFNNLPREALKEIVDLENFHCDEMEIFDGIMKWAKFNCEKMNISSEPKNLRRILGDVFCKIRFPTMKSDWFDEILLEYPNLFTGKEISDILLDIKSDKKTCLKFSHKLRKHGYAFVRDPLTLDWEKTRSSIKCFSGPFQLSNNSSSEMSIKFKSNDSRFLLGFAFIGKRRQTKKIITCKLKKDDESSSNQQHMATEIEGNWNLSWDYCLTIAFFKQKHNLETEKWYDLYCKTKCEMVNVKLNPPYSSYSLSSEEILTEKGEYNKIPYLIFE